MPPRPLRVELTAESALQQTLSMERNAGRRDGPPPSPLAAPQRSSFRPGRVCEPRIIKLRTANTRNIINNVNKSTLQIRESPTSTEP